MTDLKPTPAQFRAYLLAHDWEHRHNGLNGHEHWWHPATADYMDESYSWPPDDPDPIGGGMIEVIADKEGRCEHEVLAGMLGEMDAATALARVAEVEAERDRLAVRVAELEQLRAARKTDDRHIDRVLAMLLLREGGRVEFTAVEMHDAPAHGEFVCFENLLTRGMVLAFQASDVDMSKPDRELVIGAGSPETSALTHCPTCGAPEWHEDGRRGWNPIDVECEDCAGTYAKEQTGESND